jgi:hypothetical protein
MAARGTSSAADAKKDILDQLADDLAKQGLASLLADTDVAAYAVDWIVEEFREHAAGQIQGWREDDCRPERRRSRQPCRWR